MRFKDTSFYKEFMNIVNRGPTAIHFTEWVEFSIDDEIVVPFKLLSVNKSRVYSPYPGKENARYTDKIVIAVKLGEGTIQKSIYPNKERVIATLFRKVIGESGDSTKDTTVSILRFRANILDGKSSVLESNTYYADDTDSMDEDNLGAVQFELLGLSTEQLRLMSIQTNFRDMQLKDILQGGLTLQAGSVDLPQEDVLIGVDVAQPNNVDTHAYVSVPVGTPVMQFPRHLQEQIGVYSAGIGHYIQNKIWYVYPEYNIKRFDQVQRRLTVLNIPKSDLPGVERTFVQDGGSLTVLATGEVQHIDDGEIQQLNSGNGVRLLKGDGVHNGFWKIVDDQVVVDRKENIQEFFINERETGLNSAFFTKTIATSNLLHEQSKLARRMGTFVRFIWESADADLITPAMPCRFVFMNKEKLTELYGCVIAVDATSTAASGGIEARRYSQNASVLLFIEKYVVEKEDA
jgi:hypothetical protein